MSGQEVLIKKQKAGQNVAQGTRNFSRLSSSHRSHSLEFHETLRKWNVEGVDFGSRFHVELNSSNLIGDMALVLTLQESVGNYCAGFGSAAIRDITFRFNGRNVLSYYYKEPLFVALQKLEHAVDRDQLLKVTGGAKSGTARKVICPIFFWNDSFGEGQVGHRAPWKNVNGKLQVEIQMAEKSAVTDGNAQCAITNCEFIHTEILVPAAIERSMARPTPTRPRLVYNSMCDLPFVSNVEREIRIEPMCAGGNIRSVFFYCRDVTTGADHKFPVDSLKPSDIKLKINGVVVVDEAEHEMVWNQWTKGIRQRAGAGYILNFCETPLKSDSSGFLPANTDSVSLIIKIATTCTIDLIFEYEKILRVDSLGRYTSSDK